MGFFKDYTLKKCICWPKWLVGVTVLHATAERHSYLAGVLMSSPASDLTENGES